MTRQSLVPLGKPLTFLVIGALAAIFAVTFALPAFAQEQQVTFSDLANHFAEEPAIKRMVSQGIMTAVTPGRFDPDGATTRATFAVALHKMFGPAKPTQAITTSPPDLSETDPAHAAVLATAPFMNRQILCMGCLLSKNFFPNEPISRAESIIALVRALVAAKRLQFVSRSYAENILSSVTDSSDFPKRAKSYLATAVANGIVQLRPDHTTGPSANPTRAETAVLLDNVQKRFEMTPVKSNP